MRTFLFALPAHSRRSLAWHVPAVVLDGLTQGIAVLYLVVARKSLFASDLVVTLLTIGPVGVMLFANVFALRMIGRPKRPYFVAAALVGRAPLLGVFFVHDAASYTALLLMSFFAYLVFKPAENSILQANYERAHRGRIYGWLNAILLVASMVSAFGGGRILDGNPEAFRHLLPASGLVGLLAMGCYALLPVRALEYEKPLATRPGLFAAYRNFFDALWKDRQFGRIELCFLVYGMGIIMLDPLMVIFIVDELRLDYSEAATALGLIGQLAVLLLAPAVGRIFDRASPFKMLGWSVLLLAVFPVALCAARGAGALYFAYAIRGVAMSGILMVWNLGPIHFAGERDSSNYMGVHMTLTGVRGLAAPLLGMGMYYLIGLSGAFLVAAALFVAAGVLALRFGGRPQAVGDKIDSGNAGVAADG